MNIFLLNYIEVSKEKGILQKVMAFRRIKFKRIDIQIVAYLKKYETKKLFIIIIFYDFELWILAESVFLLEIFILNKNHSLLDNPLIFPKTKILISIWNQRTEKRKNTISQMRLRSVFKMQMSILNTATTEQMGYGIFSFFVYTKSTN